MATGTSHYIEMPKFYWAIPDGQAFEVPTNIPVINGEVEFLNWPDTWQCPYCKAKHWIEDKELNCQKCGAPRDI